MSNQEIKERLLQLTDGLLYISESDYGVDAEDWGMQDRESTLKRISAICNTEISEVKEQDAATFFSNTIKALDPGDELAATLAGQYRELFAYLLSVCPPISVFRAGEIQVQIFICCYNAEGNCFVLHTTSVET